MTEEEEKAPSPLTCPSCAALPPPQSVPQAAGCYQGGVPAVYLDLFSFQIGHRRIIAAYTLQHLPQALPLSASFLSPLREDAPLSATCLRSLAEHRNGGLRYQSREMAGHRGSVQQGSILEQIQRRELRSGGSPATILQEEWLKIPLTTVQDLYMSFPRRIDAVLAAKGGPTPY
ncbi:hypothetical protein CHARACLAT_013468 [Characodon lateralis]|uniref:Uncharacterized protein n=1 Tax=Characodon lateralis TaxID=208331 RepID=A0ABU7DG89_9TELE|nr:hypothetical protein [Characodon lateralis]